MKKLTVLILFAALLLTGCGCRPVTLAGNHTRSIPAETTSPLPAPESYLPQLVVTQGEAACEAMIGSYNWEIRNSDGTATAICVDAVHPLDIADSLPILETESLEVRLDFVEAPASILVWCYGDTEDDVQSIPVAENILPLEPGTHVYHVTASWPGSNDFTNIVHYSFRANAPEQ